MTHRTRLIPLQAGLLIVALSVLGACAQAPEDITAAYVSESRFHAWSCEQLAEEKRQLSSALTTASAQQQQARDSDIAGIILLGLPVGSLSGGNVSAQIARLKGENNAVKRARRESNCVNTVATVVQPTDSAAPSGSDPLKPQVVVCESLDNTDASRPEVKAALTRYYRQNPLQRNHYGSPVGLKTIEQVTATDIDGNLMTVKVRYRARRVHFGTAKIEACGSKFKVLSFT